MLEVKIFIWNKTHVFCESKDSCMAYESEINLMFLFSFFFFFFFSLFGCINSNLNATDKKLMLNPPLDESYTTRNKTITFDFFWTLKVLKSTLIVRL
jgi:hypothetical protein